MHVTKKLSLTVLATFFLTGVTASQGPFPGDFDNDPRILQYVEGAQVVQPFLNGSVTDPSKANIEILLHTTITDKPAWKSNTPLGAAAAIATHATEPDVLYFFEEAVGRLRRVTYFPNTPWVAKEVKDIALIPPASYFIAQTSGFPSSKGIGITPGTETVDGRGWFARGFSMNFHQNSQHPAKEFLYIAVNQLNVKAETCLCNNQSCTSVFPTACNAIDPQITATHGTLTSTGDTTRQHGIYRVDPTQVADLRTSLPWSDLKKIAPHAVCDGLKDKHHQNVPGQMLTIVWNDRANVAYVSITDQSGAPFAKQKQTPPTDPIPVGNFKADVAGTGNGALITLNEEGEIIDKWEHCLFDGISTIARAGLDGLAFDENRGKHGVLFMGNFDKSLLLTVKVKANGIPDRDTLRTVFQGGNSTLTAPAQGIVSGMTLTRSAIHQPAQGLYFSSRTGEFTAGEIEEDKLFFLDFSQFDLEKIINGAFNGDGQIGNFSNQRTVCPTDGPFIAVSDPQWNNIFVLIHKNSPYSSNSNIAFGHGENKNTLFISNTSNAYAVRRIISTLNARLLTTDADYTPNISVHPSLDH